MGKIQREYMFAVGLAIVTAIVVSTINASRPPRTPESCLVLVTSDAGSDWVAPIGCEEKNRIVL